MMNRQQADAMRRENEARSRAQYQKTQADFAASNRASQAAHQAREAAASQHAHQQRMAGYARAGDALRESIASSSAGRTLSRDAAGYSGGGSASKSKGGGLLFVLIVIGAIAYFGHSGSGPSRSNDISSSSSVYRDHQPSPTNSSPLPEKPSAVGGELPGGPSPMSRTPGYPTDVPLSGSESRGISNTTASSASAPGPAPYAPPALVPLNRISASYPTTALQTRPVGPVLVTVGVQPNGIVGSAVAESGDPLLVPAALAAARQWTFRPYPYEPGRPMHTARINFQFTPPSVARTELPADSAFGSRPSAPYTRPLSTAPVPSLQVISKVAPQYPALAQQGRMTGVVEVIVAVAPNGLVVSARAENGNPILVAAAEAAARQWRFTPYAAEPGNPIPTTMLSFRFGGQQ